MTEPTTYTRSISQAERQRAEKVTELWAWSKSAQQEYGQKMCSTHDVNLSTMVTSAILMDQDGGDSLFVAVEVWCHECSPEVGT